MDEFFALAVVLCAVVICAGSRPGSAQDIAVDPDGMVVVTGDVCDVLSIHQPDPSVEYRPGVDVDGGAVVPADLAQSGSTGSLQLDDDDVSLDLRIPLAQFYDIPPDLQPVVGDALVDLGAVTLRGGVPFLGERALTGTQQHALAAACAELQGAASR